jgi:hypothetical protein
MMLEHPLEDARYLQRLTDHLGEEDSKTIR